MSVPTISRILTDLVVAAADAAGHGGVLDQIEPAVATNNARFGDYQSNHAFRLGKALRTNPRTVAESVVAALDSHPAVAKIDVAGPGFINFTLDDDWLASHVAAQIEDPFGGIEQVGAGRVAVIDYSSPNVAKRMHVGHMRSTLIGDALRRLMTATGWRVIADNHIGDWGTQYGKLMVAWRRWLDQDAFDADPIGELERLYVAFGTQADDEMQAEARAETARLQAGDPENRALWQQFLAVSIAEFDGVYDRLGVKFDVTLGESFYHDMLPGTVAALMDAGIAEESQGAVIIKYADNAGYKGLKDTVLVIRKADGAFLYGTTDLATLAYRTTTWAPGRVVYVTDKRQQLHFKQVYAAWKALRVAQGEDPEAASLVHTWFGTLNLPGGAMSSRGGNIIRLVDFLDEAARRARVVVDEKSPELPEDERAHIAESVGVAAVRYADLSQNPQSDVNFSFDRMMSFDGNTAPYMMYSYARCRALQRKGGVTSPTMAGIALPAQVERELAVLLARFPESVSAAAAADRPNILCDHLFEIANGFNRFYFASPVLTAEDPAVRTARLALVECTARTLSRGFRMLGIEPLERM